MSEVMVTVGLSIVFSAIWTFSEPMSPVTAAPLSLTVPPLPSGMVMSETRRKEELLFSIVTAASLVTDIKPVPSIDWVLRLMAPGWA